TPGSITCTTSRSSTSTRTASSTSPLRSMEARGASSCTAATAAPPGRPCEPTERGRDSLHNLRAGDLDNDGDIDFFGANAFGANPVIVYRNTGVQANRVLVFSKTLGFRHASIPDGIKAIQQLGAANGF